MSNAFFQVSVKGLFFDEKKRLLLIREANGRWEIPGGRIEYGEELIDCLKRECLEEMGLACEVLDSRPIILFPVTDTEGREKVIIFYRVHFPSLDFKATEECVEIGFFHKEEIAKLELFPMIKKLLNFL